MHQVLRCVQCLTVFALCQPAFAQTDPPPKLFEAEDSITIRISAPWKKLLRDSRYQGTYPATMAWTGAGGEQHAIPITVERRGKTRQRVCSFPPIKIRLEKGVAKGTEFRGQRSLKMVTHCDKSSRFEPYYVKEMLAYRMYNLITDYSFRVRQLSVYYDEADGRRERKARFAFLIEDDKDVAKRNGQKKLKIDETTISKLDPAVTSRFILFQFMIGNLDWSALSGPEEGDCCHNAKLVGTDPDNGPHYPLPYDFDSSGLVNAHYARAPESLRVRNVRERLFRGFCDQNEFQVEARALFLERESAIMALIESQPNLSNHSRRYAHNYTEEFFEAIRDAEEFRAEVSRRCRG